jgi:pentatricopeptide repeat protein
MRPARLAHVATRSSSFTTPRLHLSRRWQSLNATNWSHGYTTSPDDAAKRSDKHKSRFNENAAWSGFLGGGGGQVAKAPKQENLKNDSKSVVVKEQGLPRQHKSHVNHDPDDLHQDRLAEDQTQELTRMEDDVLAQLGNSDNEGLAEELIATDQIHSLTHDTDMLQDAKEQTLAQFGSISQRLAALGATTSQASALQGHWVLLPRSSTTGEWESLDSGWLINYAALFARRLHGVDDLEPVISQRIRSIFVWLVHRMRESELETAEARMQVAVLQAIQMLRDSFPRAWPGLLTLVLRYMPDMAPAFIQASYPKIKPPFYMVADAIHFVMHFCVPGMHVQDKFGSRSKNTKDISPKDIVELILDIIPQCNHERTFLSYATIALLLDRIDLQTSYSLFTCLRSFDSDFGLFSPSTFADFFARHGEYESALEALELFLNAGGSVEESSFKRAAAKILRRSILHPQGYHDSGYIISRFMDMGSIIGLHFQTTLIANAFDSKDAPTALNIFSLMREQGIEPDAQAYTTLLRGLRASEDEALVDDILGLAWAKIEETKDNFLAAELLYWHYSQHVRSAEQTWDTSEKAKIHRAALQQLVTLYTRIFDTAPLEVLNFGYLAPPREHTPWASFDIRPTPFIMALMILAYTRAFVLLTENERRSQHGIGTNEQMYQHWHHVASRWTLHPEVPEWVKELFLQMMTQSSHTHNIFMHALGAQSATLYGAVTILQRMDAGTVNINTSTDTEGQVYRVEEVARPNLFTWSILLNAFARHGQCEAAEKSFQTMQEKGIAPGAAAWNTLVKSYAVRQDYNGVVSALKRKEAAGFGMDRGVVRVLTRIKNPDALKALLHREVDSRDTGVSDAKLLGIREENGKRADKYLSYKWRPDSKQAEGYEPGKGRRRVNYFDANRTSGLHKESWAVAEEDTTAQYWPVHGAAGTRAEVLEGQGSFVLKSEDEQDWFEDDDDQDFSVSPMDNLHGEKR